MVCPIADGCERGLTFATPVGPFGVPASRAAVVVDAFWEVANRRPADVLPYDEPTAAIAIF